MGRVSYSVHMDYIQHTLEYAVFIYTTVGVWGIPSIHR
jgi:hypothetical protein